MSPERRRFYRESNGAIGVGLKSRETSTPRSGPKQRTWGTVSSSSCLQNGPWLGLARAMACIVVRRLQRVQEREELLLLCCSELIEAALYVFSLALVTLDGVGQG
jgi:hypothetical protein